MVQDDGQGGASHEGAFREGSGLRGMRERVESVQGEIDVENEGGTLVRVRLPLMATAKPAAFVSDRTVYSGAFPDMDVQRS